MHLNDLSTHPPTPWWPPLYIDISMPSWSYHALHTPRRTAVRLPSINPFVKFLCLYLYLYRLLYLLWLQCLLSFHYLYFFHSSHSTQRKDRLLRPQETWHEANLPLQGVNLCSRSYQGTYVFVVEVATKQEHLIAVFEMAAENNTNNSVFDKFASRKSEKLLFCFEYGNTYYSDVLLHTSPSLR